MNKNLQLTLSLLLLCGLVQAQIVNLGGTITVQSGATLVVEGNVSNLSTGTINNEGTIEIKGNLLNEASSMLVGTDGTYLFSGTDAATITSNGAAIQNLTIDKAGANVTLVDPLTVNGILAFGNAGTGKLVLGGQSLTLGTGSSIMDADANGYIVAVGAGSVVKNMSAPTGFTFEVGDATNYSPITFANNAGAGAGSVSARVVTVAHPNKPGTSNDFITRYWPVVTSYPSTFTGTYVDGDITGTEANIKGASFNELAVLNQAGSAGNDAENTVTVNTIEGMHDVTGFAALIREFMLKAILQGPYNAMTDVMSTNLKSLGYLPTQSPYNANETVANQAAIPNDVVDWILIELVDPNNSATVYAAQSAFLKSNGDITNLANSSIVSFNNVIQSSVSIRLKHRNHLSVRTEAVTLSGETLEFDFRLGNDIFNDGLVANLPMRNFSASKNGMWGGDVNQDNRITYLDALDLVTFQGIPSDALSILTLLGNNTTIVLNTYNVGDINMDGKTTYLDALDLETFQGIPSDALKILSNANNQTNIVISRHN